MNEKNMNAKEKKTIFEQQNWIINLDVTEMTEYSKLIC